MTESVVVDLDDKYSVEYKPTGYMSRVSWVLRRKTKIRPAGRGAYDSTIASPVYSGQGRNPEAAKKQAERAYLEAIEQERLEKRVLQELRGFHNQ